MRVGRDICCLAGSVLLHLGVLGLGGMFLVKSAEFGMEAGERELAGASGALEAEVELAAPKPEPQPEPVMATPEPPPEVLPTPEPTPEPVVPPTPEPPPTPMVEATPEPTPPPEIIEEGDEPIRAAPKPTPRATPSKPKPAPSPKTTGTPAPVKPQSVGAGGATQAGSGSGAATARSDKKATYLRNPQPPYPAEARRNKQEGKVTLRVGVSASGDPESVSVAKSSGYPLLDNSAVTTVRQKWKFRPASVNGVNISSVVNIPVRFALD